jgi:hypothetical protein
MNLLYRDMDREALGLEGLEGRDGFLSIFISPMKVAMSVRTPKSLRRESLETLTEFPCRPRLV